MSDLGGLLPPWPEVEKILVVVNHYDMLNELWHTIRLAGHSDTAYGLHLKPEGSQPLGDEGGRPLFLESEFGMA